MSTFSKLFHLPLHRDHDRAGSRDLDRALARAVTASTRSELLVLQATRSER